MVGSEGRPLGGRRISGAVLPTNVYIDGFNLYYGALRRTPYKWLDLANLSQRLFPTHAINRIRYFTARVTALPHDPQVAARQDVYLRALRTIPTLTIHEGFFRSHPVLAPQYPLAYRPPTSSPSRSPQLVQILKTEEKGSDVNLATQLLVDAFQGDFDEAVVVSNDSDLAEPIRVVVALGKPVTVVNPQFSSATTWKLRQVASSTLRRINRSALQNSQFPSPMADTTGSFSKPSGW